MTIATEKAICEDLQLLVQQVQKEKWHTQQHTKLISTSLGGGVAIELAQRGLVKKMVVISTFTSIDDMVALSVPTWIPSLLNHYKFYVLEKAKGLDLETPVIHGDNDNIIPF